MSLGKYGLKAWTGTRLSRVLQGRGWPVTAYQPVSAYSQLDKSVPAAPQGLPAAAQGLPAAAQGLPAAAHGLAHGLAAAAHPQRLGRGGPPAAATCPLGRGGPGVALTLLAGLPAAARGPLVPARP